MGNKIYKKVNTELVSITISLNETYHLFEESPEKTIKDLLSELEILSIKKRCWQSNYKAIFKDSNVELIITNSNHKKVNINDTLGLHKNKIIFVDIKK